MRRPAFGAMLAVLLAAGACTTGDDGAADAGATVTDVEATPTTADPADDATVADPTPAEEAAGSTTDAAASDRGALDTATPGSERSSAAAEELVATLPSLPELGRYDEPADVHVAPGGGGDGSSPDDPLGSIADAVLQAGEGGIVELAAGSFGDVVLPASEESTTWTTPVVVRAETPADWREAWRIVAEEDYVLGDDGEVAPATFDGIWTTELASFESRMTGVQLVGVGIAGQVSVRDARVEFDRIVSSAPGNRWYPRSDFTLSRSVLAWPVAVESGDRLQIAGDGAGRPVVLDRVMVGNVFRRQGSDSHSDSLQTLTDARLVVRRSALLAAANRVQLSSIGDDSVIADTYIESYGDAKRAGFFVPPTADTSSTDSAIMADGDAPTLVRVRVLGGVNDVSATSPFTVLDSVVRGYGGDLAPNWTGTVLEDGPTDGLPDAAGNEAGTVAQRRPGPPSE